MCDSSSVGFAIPKGIGVSLSLILGDASRGHGGRLNWRRGEDWSQCRLQIGGGGLHCFDTSAKMARGSRRLSSIVILAILVSLVMSMATCLGQCSQGGKWKKESLE